DAEHRRLCGRDLLRRAPLGSEGRHRGGRCLWHVGLVAIPPRDLADDDAAGMARLYQRGDLPLPGDDAGLFLGFPRLPAEGRLALLRLLLRGQDIQPLRRLPRHRLLLRGVDADPDLGLRAGEPPPEPPPAAESEKQNPLASPAYPVVSVI